MSLARRRNLVPEDVWKLTLDNKSEVLSKKFSQLKLVCIPSSFA